MKPVRGLRFGLSFGRSAASLCARATPLEHGETHFLFSRCKRKCCAPVSCQSCRAAGASGAGGRRQAIGREIRSAAWLAQWLVGGHSRRADGRPIGGQMGWRERAGRRGHAEGVGGVRYHPHRATRPRPRTHQQEQRGAQSPQSQRSGCVPHPQRARCQPGRADHLQSHLQLSLSLPPFSFSLFL